MANSAAILDIGVGTMEHKQATTYSTTAGNLTLAPAGQLVMSPVGGNIQFNGDLYALVGGSANGPRLMDEAASLTNPVFTSNDIDTGLGFNSTSDTPVLIGGSKSLLSCNGSTDRSCTAYGDNGATRVCGFQGNEVLTFSGGGDASQVTTGLIPAGATDISVVAVVTTAGTTCAGASYGDGVDVDLYGADLAVAATTTMDPSDYTATVNYNATSGDEVTITGTNGAGVPADCVDMVVRVMAYYCTLTAPTG